MYFENRQDAGRKLAEKLLFLRGADAAILALPRGWVPVAYEVAQALDLPLDTIIVRKLWIHFNPEFGFGAVSEAWVVIMDREIIRMASMSTLEIEKVIKMETLELERRKKRYRSGEFLQKKTYDYIVVIDDGVATGATMEAAIEAIKILYHPREIIAASPVIASDSARKISRKVGRLVVLHESPAFGAVGQYYRNFPQTSDEEVISLLYSRKNLLEGACPSS